jgi:poly(hydroxyalkanoate) depolymerase family esterase
MNPMRGLSEAMALLKAFRQKFETLLAAARAKAGRTSEALPASATRLREVTRFGSNPGNLRMFAYVPERLPTTAPLVVALHGCSQTADEYDYGAGWSSLSERLGFAVVYPQQQPANNSLNCFSWFSPGDVERGHGEALSIRQMVEHAIASFGLDQRKVFVTGLSAGGAMASVMLATYPEVFAGGAIIAGLPYGCARTVLQAFNAMFTEQSTDALALGDRLRESSRHRGPWPKVSIWHGTVDPIVKPSNSEDIIQQWANVHGIPATPSYEEFIGSHRRRVWSGADGEALIEAFSINGMGHGVPLAMTMGEDNCGAVGTFFLDAGISSIHHIARFWRMGEDLAEMPRVPATALEPHQIRAEGNAVVTAGQAACSPSNSEETSFNPEQEALRRS